MTNSFSTTVVEVMKSNVIFAFKMLLLSEWQL